MLNKNNLGGVKVTHHKTTAHLPAEAMPIPDKVSIPMLQHLGPACDVKVQVGETVKVGRFCRAVYSAHPRECFGYCQRN